MDRPHRARNLGLELVEELHGLDQAQRLVREDGVADVHEYGCPRARRAVEDADHRRLDADRAVQSESLLRRGLDGFSGRDGRERASRQPRLVRAPHGDAHALVLDLDLADAALLDDLHEIADPPRALGVRVLGDEGGLPRVARADLPQQLLGIGAEHRDEDELLLACGETLGLFAHVLGGQRLVLDRRHRREQRDRTLDRRVDRLGRLAVPALNERPELVDDAAVAACLEHVQERLAREDLADGRGKRRPPCLGADAADLLEHFLQAVLCAVGAQVDVERRDEARREVVLGRAHGDARRDRRDGLVSDVLVDDVRGLPQARRLEAGRMAEPLERLGERLAGDAVQRERERVHGRRDEVRARLDGRERAREAGACGALDVEADRQPARLLDPRHELLRAVREEGARRVVHDHAGSPELGQLPRLLDERVRLACAARAVDEASVEGAARARDRVARLAKVRDVVERVVEPEDLDAVLRSAGDEARDDVAADRLRADEEASPERDPERRRDARLDRADPLPWRLRPAADGCVEDAAARDLEARKPCLVEDLRDAQDLRRRQRARERLLGEESDGRVDELRHDQGP